MCSYSPIVVDNDDGKNVKTLYCFRKSLISLLLQTVRRITDEDIIRAHVKISRQYCGEIKKCRRYKYRKDKNVTTV